MRGRSGGERSGGKRSDGGRSGGEGSDGVMVGVVEGSGMGWREGGGGGVERWNE